MPLSGAGGEIDEGIEQLDRWWVKLSLQSIIKTQPAPSVHFVCYSFISSTTPATYVVALVHIYGIAANL